MKLVIYFTIIFFFNMSDSSVIREIVFSLNNKFFPAIQYKDDGLDLKKEVKFFLYTRKTKDSPEELYIDDTETLENSAYNVSLPTKLITHGWKYNYKSDSCMMIKQALLATHNFNVIVIDWGAVAHQLYVKAASRVRAIGHYIGKMLQFLLNEGTDPSFISLIGHSLGAHIMGFAGKIVNPKVNHIVGLDPAGISFESQDPNNRLSPEDAEFVEVIHTNMGQAGISVFTGSAEFYPNGGGPKQPGCPDEHFDNRVGCAHIRAFMYYAEGIENPKSWYGVLCNSYDDFNNGKCVKNEIRPFPSWSGTFKTKPGKYMLRTNSASPYGRGVDGTKPAD